MNKPKPHLIAISLVFFAPSFAVAQSLTNTQLPLDRILQQKNLEDREKQLFKKPVKLEGKQKEIIDPKDASAKCITIENVVFSGMESFGSFHQKKLAKLVNGKCLDNLGLENFFNQIINYYVDYGYSNSRPYFKQYDSSTKTLYLIIAEGKIANIFLNNIKPQKNVVDNIQNSGLRRSDASGNNDDSSSKSSLRGAKGDAAIQNDPMENSFSEKSQAFFAIPASKGDVFNIRDFEQGISNFNRLRSNNATIESRPSSISGESDIIINNYQNNSGGLFHGYQTSINYENSGSKSSGVYNTTYAINKDNLLQINDNINLSQIKSDRSETNMLGITIPFGYWSFKYNDSANKYKSYTSSGTIIEGTSTNHDLSLDRLLFRGKTQELNLNSNLNLRNQTRKTSGFVDIKSQRLSTGRIGFDYSFRKPSGVINFSFLYSKGLKIHSAIDDKKDFATPLDKDGVRAQFEKYTYNLNLYKPINEYLSYNLQGTIQHSPDSLYASELIFVGGSKYSVRGLQYDGISGSKGGYGRNDLNFDVGRFLNKRQIKSENKILQKIISEVGNVRLNFFYDSGYARAIFKDGDVAKTDYISGAGAGVKYYGKYFNFDVTYASNLRAPKYTKIGNDHKNSAIYAGIGARYEW